MLIQQTLGQLHELRLPGMAQAFEEQMQRSDIEDLTFEDRLALLLEREITFRDDRRLARLLQVARLRLPAAVEDLDLRSARGLDRSLILRLAGCQWIRDHETVLVSGATGTGKSYLACALAHSACRSGFSTRYFRFSRLLGELALARADGSYPKLLDRLAKAQLLVLDDFGLATLTDSERRDLLEVMEDRYGRRATLLTSQLPFEHWHAVMGDATFRGCHPRPDRPHLSQDHPERTLDEKEEEPSDGSRSRSVNPTSVATLRGCSECIGMGVRNGSD